MLLFHVSEVNKTNSHNFKILYHVRAMNTEEDSFESRQKHEIAALQVKSVKTSQTLNCFSKLLKLSFHLGNLFGRLFDGQLE